MLWNCNMKFKRRIKRTTSSNKLEIHLKNDDDDDSTQMQCHNSIIGCGILKNGNTHTYYKLRINAWQRVCERTRKRKLFTNILINKLRRKLGKMLDVYKAKYEIRAKMFATFTQFPVKIFRKNIFPGLDIETQWKLLLSFDVINFTISKLDSIHQAVIHCCNWARKDIQGKTGGNIVTFYVHETDFSA